MDLDETGNAVSIAMEHTSLRSDLYEVTLKRINKSNNELMNPDPAFEGDRLVREGRCTVVV